jgi:hypothetical protein
VEHGRVFVVGDKPKWLNKAIHIPFKDKQADKTLNAWDKLIHICQNDEVSENFILFNDDFIIRKPFKEFPYYYRGELIKSASRSASYIRSKAQTGSEFEKPLDYELHCPLVYNRKKFLELINHYDLTKKYLHRSLYCNHYEVGGEFMVDVKSVNVNMLNQDMHRDIPFVSFTDNIENEPAFHAILHKFYPSMSEYERYDLGKISSNIDGMLAAYKPRQENKTNIQRMEVKMRNRKFVTPRGDRNRLHEISRRHGL